MSEDNNRCIYCGCFLPYVDNSYLSEGGWCEDEGYGECHNKKCKMNKHDLVKEIGNEQD